MNLLINPGSGALQDDTEWENTEDQARKNVYEWFYKPLIDQGYQDIECINLHEQNEDGRWLFKMRHKITGIEKDIEAHGITDIEAYVAKHIFHPRTYYDGSSGGNPTIEDFAKDGFKPFITYRKARMEDE